MTQLLLFAEFILQINGKCLIRDVSLRLRNGFRVLVDVHEMAINHKVPYKQYDSTENILKSPNILWLF